METVALSRFTLTFAAEQIQISMTQVERFQDNEIPFEVLASFGLSKEMVEDLPMKVLEKLLSGQRTPLLPISIQDKTGNSVSSSARLSLVRTEDGVDVMFMPIGESSLLETFDNLQQESLRTGKVLYSETDNLYYQLDGATHQIISMPSHVIQHNLGVLGRQLDMEDIQKKAFQSGEIVMLENDDAQFTIGLDLTQDVGIRMVVGDMERWNEEVSQDDFPLYSFGINGCWVNDGQLSYVYEKDYTQEMQDALKEQVNQARSSGMHR